MGSNQCANYSHLQKMQTIPFRIQSKGNYQGKNYVKRIPTVSKRGANCSHGKPMTYAKITGIVKSSQNRETEVC
jgi:hypothetical protein